MMTPKAPYQELATAQLRIRMPVSHSRFGRALDVVCGLCESGQRLALH
jgi:hypothetical protein